MEQTEKREKAKTTVAIVVIALLAAVSAVFAALYVTAKANENAADDRYRALAESTYRKRHHKP